MIQTLTDLPAGVVGVQLSGKVEADDYRSTLLPLIEQARQAGDIRMVVDISDFEGMTAGAMVQDAKAGFENIRNWKRLAIVSDSDAINHAISIFGWLMPGDIKTFSSADRASAVQWAAT